MPHGMRPIPCDGHVGRGRPIGHSTIEGSPSSQLNLLLLQAHRPLKAEIAGSTFVSSAV